MRVGALMVLLTLGALLPAPTAAAQEDGAFLCFSGERNAFQDPCQDPFPPAPNYLQGEAVGITVENVGTSQPYVRVTCKTGCHEVQGRDYYAVWRGSQLVFPRDFTAKRGDEGGNAVLDKVPRYNGTWEVTVLMATSPTRTFNVWMMDLYASRNWTLQPGENHLIRAAGFEPRAPLEFRVERRGPGGSYEPLHVHADARADANGVYLKEWQVPKDEAAEIRKCGAARADCYRFVVRGAGKEEEIIPFRVGLATMVHNPSNSVVADNGPLGERPQPIERTRNATVALDLFYPGGRYLYNQQAKLLPDDLLPSAFFGGEHVLRVSVERVFTSNGTVKLVADVPMRYEPLRFRWEATWTVPRDLPTDDAPSVYRMQLAAASDKHGNHVPQFHFGNYTVQAASLAPAVAEAPLEVERASEGVFAVEVRYHNGSLLTDRDNATPLRACFVKHAETPTPTCAGAPLVDGKFDGERWTFKARYGRTYADLQPHVFILQAGTRDRWGNAVQEARSDPFDVVAARLRVNFTTVMRGLDAQELERGQYVSVQARVTYPDGSAFNRTHQPNESAVLAGTLTRRGPTGAIMFEEPFNLTETDRQSGRWIGGLQLGYDDTRTPLGTWSWTFRVRDNLSVPNENDTRFDREVVGAPIQLKPTLQPPTNAATGTDVKFRFQLHYQDGDGRRPVPESVVGSRVTARVLRWDPVTRLPVGEPISNVLQPLHSDRTGDWSIEYRLPAAAFRGTYVFVVSGTDLYGNKLAADSWSRPFSTYPQVIERGVLTQPADEVRRGESATVVFDAREGDRGPDGNAPFVSVERWDSTTQQWVREARDVRQGAGFEDHVGFFPVAITTPVGVYRFALEGVDADLNRLQAFSANFSVLPTEVARAIVTPVPREITKGETFTFSTEAQDGDRYIEARAFLNGRRVEIQQPIVESRGGRINVTWTIPFESPAGNYSLRLLGRDLVGNVITVQTPQIQARAAQLEGKILGNPARTVDRGDAATLLFGITYPTGAYYVAADVPRVQVLHEGAYVDDAKVQRSGLTFTASWTPPDSAEIGEYVFDVSGQGAGGNLFPPMRSTPFRIVPGVVTRTPIQDVTGDVERLAAATFAVPLHADDTFVGFTLGYFGPATVAPRGVFDDREPITVSSLAHTIEPESGRYVTRFATDQQTPAGAYRIFMEGEDRHGNKLVARSEVFILRPTSIVISWDPFPSQSALEEGAKITFSMTARYRHGAVFDDANGRPSAVMLYNGVPVTQRPDVEYRAGRWFLSWNAPETLPDGEYTLSVGGADLSGNGIVSSTTIPYRVTSTLGNSFAKTVPGPDLPLLLVGLAALALALARRGR